MTSHRTVPVALVLGGLMVFTTLINRPSIPPRRTAPSRLALPAADKKTVDRLEEALTLRRDAPLPIDFAMPRPPRLSRRIGEDHPHPIVLGLFALGKRRLALISLNGSTHVVETGWQRHDLTVLAVGDRTVRFDWRDERWNVPLERRP